jgi:hypothetical protein
MLSPAIYRNLYAHMDHGMDPQGGPLHTNMIEKLTLLLHECEDSLAI